MKTQPSQIKITAAVILAALAFVAFGLVVGLVYGYDAGRNDQRIESNRQIKFYKDHYVPRGF